MAAKDKKPMIGLPTDAETHQRYRVISAAIQARGIDIGKTIPKFLIATLEQDSTQGFAELKKYL
jgi:hypothetical protein